VIAGASFPATVLKSTTLVCNEFSLKHIIALQSDPLNLIQG